MVFGFPIVTENPVRNTPKPRPFPGGSDSLRTHLPSPQLQREKKQIGATQNLHNQEDIRKGLRNAGKAGDRDGQIHGIAGEDAGQQKQPGP